MEIALRQAKLAPADLQHLNAHATSTPAGDESELGAIAALFGRNRNIAVSATKSATGHLLGAAGGLEAIFTVLALRDQVAPPTRNFENRRSRRGWHRHRRRQRRGRCRCSTPSPTDFGFGGVNASVIFRRMG